MGGRGGRQVCALAARLPPAAAGGAGLGALRGARDLSCGRVAAPPRQFGTACDWRCHRPERDSLACAPRLPPRRPSETLACQKLLIALRARRAARAQGCASLGWHTLLEASFVTCPDGVPLIPALTSQAPLPL